MTTEASAAPAHELMLSALTQDELRRALEQVATVLALHRAMPSEELAKAAHSTLWRATSEPSSEPVSAWQSRRRRRPPPQAQAAPSPPPLPPPSSTKEVVISQWRKPMVQPVLEGI
jgi:Chromatin remodeling protein, contains PhD zinc finger